MADEDNGENNGNGHPKTPAQRFEELASAIEALTTTLQIHSRAIHILRGRIENLERQNAH